MKEAQKQLQEVHTLLEEYLHKTSLQEEAARWEVVVQREESIARGARVRALL